MIGAGTITRQQRSTRTLRDGTVLRRDETRKVHPPECAWCSSDHLWLTFAINRGELHGPFA